MVKDADLERIANHTILILVSRVAMLLTPFVVSALVWAGSAYLADKFAAQTAALIAVSQRIDRIEAVENVTIDKVGALRERLAVTEAAVTTSRDARLSFQTETSTRLDKLNDSMGQLLASVSALQATVVRAARQ